MKVRANLGLTAAHLCLSKTHLGSTRSWEHKSRWRSAIWDPNMGLLKRSLNQSWSPGYEDSYSKVKKIGDNNKKNINKKAYTHKISCSKQIFNFSTQKKPSWSSFWIRSYLLDMRIHIPGSKMSKIVQETAKKYPKCFPFLYDLFLFGIARWDHVGKWAIQ